MLKALFKMINEAECWLTDKIGNKTDASRITLFCMHGRCLTGFNVSKQKTRRDAFDNSIITQLFSWSQNHGFIKM